VNIKGESYRLKEKRKAGLLAKNRSSQTVKEAAIEEPGEDETLM
jgi:hypothetical protein